MDLIVYQVIVGLFCAGAVFAMSFFMGYRPIFGNPKCGRPASAMKCSLSSGRSRLFGIMRSKPRKRQKTELEQHIQFLESKLEQYRRKAAGIGMMGLRKTNLAIC